VVSYCRRYLSGARCKWPTQPRHLSGTGNEYRHIGVNNLPKVSVATSLSCRVSAISAFCWPTTQTPSITNSLVAVVHTKPVIAILVPKLVAMATSLGTAKSAMSLSDSLNPKTHPLESNKSQKLVAMTPSLSTSGPHLTHDSLGPSEPTTKTASRWIQPFLHR